MSLPVPRQQFDEAVGRVAVAQGLENCRSTVAPHGQPGFGWLVISASIM
jgi:hypothetical protein